ncbi:MAG: anti-anti-sigma factor [bacterium]|jgi:anti-anti-sigma factor
MHVITCNKEDIEIILLLGNLSFNGVQNIKKEVWDIVSSPKTMKLLINFEAVQFISPSGINFLSQCYKELYPRSGKIGIYGCRDDIFELLHETQINTFIPIFRNEKQALLAFSKIEYIL